MDKINHRRRKPKRPKKILLSTVDPWDVKVASIEPEKLSTRRGASLSVLTCTPDGATSPISHPSTPSPWYKPDPSSPGLRSATTADSSDQGALTSPEWPLPWYKPLRSATTDSIPGSTQSVPSHKLLPARANSQEEGPPNTETIDEATERNIRDFQKSNGEDSEVGRSSVVQIHSEDERTANNKNYPPQIGWNNQLLPKIIVNDEIPTKPAKINHENEPNIEDNDRAVERGEIHKNGIDHSLEIGKGIDQQAVVFIVNDLVKARYSPKTARERRLNRPSSRSPPAYEDTVAINIGATKPSNTGDSAVVNAGSSPERIEKAEAKKTTSISMPDRLNTMDGLNNSMRPQGAGSRFQRNDSDSSATFSNSGSTPRGSPLDSDTDDDVNDEELAKVPLQAPPRRKATIVPMGSSQKINKDQLEIPVGQSVNSTITSVNSISSLLKEKLQFSIPQALRSSKKQQNADYRLKTFVGVLFLCVVFLVGFAHVYYTQNVLQRAYFDRFRFNKNDRVMHVYSRTGAEIIAGRLGEGLPPETGVFPCLAKDERTNAVCLEWLQQARLYLSHTEQDDMHCYQVTWQSLSPGYDPMDCFDWSPNRGHWYGAGQTQSMAYPLEVGNSVLELTPFITGDARKNSFGNVLKRYFLNSKGATITVDPKTPLYVSINANRTKEFCVQAKHDSFAYVNHLTPLPQLNYTLCSFENMKTLHSLMTEKSLWDGLKKEDADVVTSLLSEPVWQISATNEVDLYNYTEDVRTLGFFKQGHVVLSEEWQANPGDFSLDEERFPSMKDTIEMMYRRGFKIVFSIQPFISTESVNFKEVVASRLLISERGSDPRIPALTRYKKSNSAAVLDITNNKTLPWLQTKLQSLVEKYKVDSFYLDLGNAYDMPHYYTCQRPLHNPDHYKTLFTQSILTSVPVIGVSGAITRPRAPVFVSLPPFSSSWKAIKTVIPTILNYGIVGYPFIMPGAVGGDVALPMSDNNPINDFDDNLPDKELYVRWLQLSTFLPVIRFSHLPSAYSDESVIEITKSLTTLRQKTVTPLLKKYAFEALDSGLPIIRPLWMLDPVDPACHVVVDEFSVGEELIVAPILYSGSRQREVYLPSGVWKDGIDGSLRKGSRWIHNYRVSEDKVAYFVKMPDNTRF